MKASRASRGLQPGNLTLPRPPHQLLWEEGGGGGGDKRKVAWPKWKPETIPFSSLDSYSPEIFHSPPHRHHPSSHITVRSATLVLDTVSLTDWLTGWLTICHSCSSNVSLSSASVTSTLFFATQRHAAEWKSSKTLNALIKMLLLQTYVCLFVS